MIICLKNFVASYDQFGATVGFQINGRSEYKTCLGGFLYLIFVIFFLFYFFFNFIGFISRQNMTLISTYKILVSPVKINFSESNFSVGFTLLFDKNNSAAIERVSEFFDFNIHLATINNATKRTKIEIPLERCQPNDFNSVDIDTFIYLQLDKALCPSKAFENNMNIEGKFGDPVFTYLQATISLKPKLINYLDQLRNYLEENPIKTIMYYQDTSISYDNFEEPLDKFINSIYKYIDLNKVLKTDFFFFKARFWNRQ